MRKNLLFLFGMVVLGLLNLRACAQEPGPAPEAPQDSNKVAQEAQQPPANQPPVPITPIGPPTPLDSPPPMPLANGNNGVFSGLGAANPCCGNNGCGGCCDRPIGFTFEGGVYIFMPYFSGGNPAYHVQNVGVAGGAFQVANNQRDYQSQINAAPIGIISYSWNGTDAIRGRYFQLFNTNYSAGETLTGGQNVISAGGINVTPLGTTPGATVAATSSLSLMAIDLEYVHRFVCTKGWFEVSVGARYAQISQTASLTVADPMNGTGSSTTSHNFYGFGPTAGVEGHRQIGCTDFGIYGSARGSLLFGSSAQNYFSADQLGNTIVGASSSAVILPVGELEAGGEWSHNWGRFHVFAQVGAVGQLWLGGGNAATGANLSGIALSGQSNSPANFGFFGGVVRAGFTF